MKSQIREQLLALREEEYQKFSQKLLPGIDHILGVRAPTLRKIAAKIARADWRRYLEDDDDFYMEEIMLQGMIIGLVKVDAKERLALTRAFIPKIQNWSVCDAFCSGLKFTQQHKALVWEFLQPYFVSRAEYEIRFAVVMFLDYFIDETYLPRGLALLDAIRHEGYYVKMAVAWALSICYVKLPESTLPYLTQNTLDDFTYHKALQKITESYRVDAEEKKMIRGMRRVAANRAGAPG